MKTAYLNGSEITGKRGLHAALADQLDFPVWYGHNLDALYDLLTTEREEAVRIVVRDRASLEEALGGYFRVFLGVLEDIADEGGDVSVVFADETDDSPEESIGQ